MSDLPPAIVAAEAQEKATIRQYFGNRQGGVFVEVGANDPLSPESQSLHLERELGWTGLLVEPQPALAEKARQTRPASIVCQCACTAPESQGELELSVPLVDGQRVTGHAALGENLDEHNYRDFDRIRVPGVTLASLLDRHGIASVDLLSIDVEGAELEVLKGADLGRTQPRLILLEDKHLYLSKHRLLSRHGYRLVRRLNRNSWYVRAGEPIPEVPFGERARLWKRMYVSIWYKKLVYALRHKTLAPFCQL